MANFLYCENETWAFSNPLNEDVLRVAPLFFCSRGKVSVTVEYLMHYHKFLKDDKKSVAELFYTLSVDKIKQVNNFCAQLLSRGIDAKRVFYNPKLCEVFGVESYISNSFNRKKFEEMKVENALLNALILEIDCITNCVKTAPYVKDKRLKETLKQLILKDSVHAVLIGAELEKFSSITFF